MSDSQTGSQGAVQPAIGRFELTLEVADLAAAERDRNKPDLGISCCSKRYVSVGAARFLRFI